MPRKSLLLAMLLLAVPHAGCSTVHYMLDLVTPRPPARTIPAEFDGLAGQSVAIVIQAEPAVDYEYPGARLEMASLVASQLRSNVKNVSVSDPRRVLRYQQDNLLWDQMERVRLARELDVDYVLLISLIEYTMRQPGSADLYRGEIIAHAGVFDAERDEREARVWNGEFAVVYPPGSTIGQAAVNDAQTRYHTVTAFAEQLARSFYSYKEQR